MCFGSYSILLWNLSVIDVSFSYMLFSCSPDFLSTYMVVASYSLWTLLLIPLMLMFLRLFLWVPFFPPYVSHPLSETSYFITSAIIWSKWWWFSCWVMSDSCDPMSCSPPGSSVHRIFQARILEWIAISFSRGSSWPRDWTWVSCTAGRLFTSWTTW